MKKTLIQLILSLGFIGLMTTSYTAKNASEQKQSNKEIFLRRGVEVDLVINGMISSRQHPTRKAMRIYVMNSFDGRKCGIPRNEREIAAGIKLVDFDNKAVNIKIRALPVATGDLRSTAILKLLSIEKITDKEAHHLQKEGSSKNRRENKSFQSLAQCDTLLGHLGRTYVTTFSQMARSS